MNPAVDTQASAPTPGGKFPKRQLSGDLRLRLARLPSVSGGHADGIGGGTCGRGEASARLTVRVKGAGGVLGGPDNVEHKSLYLRVEQESASYICVVWTTTLSDSGTGLLAISPNPAC